MATKRITVGSLIDDLSSIRDEKRALAEQEKKLNEKYDAIEAQLIELMDKEGVTKSTGKKASAGIAESTQFSIEDWDKFWAFLVKNKASHLVQRRVSAPAVREISEVKGKTPDGLKPFQKRQINLRDLTTT